ncbi:MAG: HEAT repeat domain-containing protein [Acidobacteria bacterium]|nr:HEAT repeat domain-containing protein [Acidobacteriota bacterium]MBI3423385.1 HEAT repeat domain-containing protein [Acidobacteriota bacterium]
MNSVLETLDPLARLAVQALLNSLWQGLLIAALVWVLLHVLGRVSATTRHALWLISLLTISLLPLAGMFWAYPRATNLPKPEPESGRLTVTATAPIARPPQVLPLSSTAMPFRNSSVSLPAQLPKEFAGEPLSFSVTASAPVTAAPALTPVAATKPGVSGWIARLNRRFSNWLADWFNGRTPLWLAALWLMASALLGGRIARSYVFLFRLRRRLEPVSEALAQRKDYLAARFGIGRAVGLCSAASVKMPLTIGWLRPLIVLPSDLPESLSSVECDSVIAHELAHIKRLDYVTNFAQRLIQAALFFHPAVWFINKQLVIERELACDDWAVKLTGEPRRYASCLTKLVELLSESKPLAAATGILFGKHIISRRVEMILNRDRNATTSVSKPALAYAIGLAFLFVFACSALSPVIAVPLGQKPAKKAPEVKPAKPAPTAPRAEATTILPGDILDELPVPARIEFDGPDGAAIVIPALPPLPAFAELPEWAVDAPVALQDGPRVAPAAPLAPLPPEAPLAPLAWADALGTTIPAQAYAPATPMALAGTIPWGQNATAQSKTPAIPEAELLSLLTDIVKKDSDENVRREALQGIYRMHNSDAAINSLISLYDSISDVKTKSEILNYLMRRTGDNSKAIAKLVQIAKSEKDENLMRAALNQLAYVKGDEGADHLIAIYDGMQDPKLKQRVIRALAYNKSKKAVDKLMAIAKNDSDPTVRTAAIRSLYEIDNRLYLNFAEGTRQSLLTEPKVLTIPRVNLERMNEQMLELKDHMRFDFEGKKFELNKEQLNDAMKRANEAMERARDLNGKLHFEFDGKAFELNKEQLLEFQNRARAAQERATEQMRELQERLRDEWREGEPRVYRVTPEARPPRKEERDQQREERKSNQEPKPASKPATTPKPASYNAARI